MLRTKLHAPVRQELVPRRQLLETLATTAPRRLTVVVAPAGWGKTSLLSQWSAVDGQRRAFAWVSLDPDDNDRVRFWTYVLEALRGVAPGVGDTAMALLPARGARDVEAFLPTLLNDLAGVPNELVLVLDDYHVIANAEVHRSMAYLIEHLPDRVHVAIATRVDPALPLARLTARRELLEIREGALRFSDEEAGALLNGVLGLDLAPADVAMLQRKTEGWAAGLCLAALSMRAQSDVRGFLDDFAGNERRLVDYLTAEALQQVSLPLRDFLLDTSVLTRFSAPLCDAVLARSDSDEALRELERANLFVVPLDPRREWYRYHHLFAELLRHELKATKPGVERTLHRRAATWFRKRGLAPEAIHHATQAGTLDDAAQLIADHWLEFFNLGRLGSVERWLNALPELLVTQDARLCVARAWLALDSGRLDDVRRWTDAATRAMDRSGEPVDADLRSGVETLRTVRLFKEGDLVMAGASARETLDREQGTASFPATVASLIDGITSLWLGRADTAEASLRDAEALGRATANSLGTAYALGYLAISFTERGDLEATEAAVDEVDRIVEAEPVVGEHFVAMAARLAQGRLRERQGRMDEATRAFERALELAERGAGRLEVAAALLSLAERRHAERAADDARRLVDRAAALVDACEEPGAIRGWARRVQRTFRADAAEASGGVPSLSEREAVVLRMLPSELSLREIAESLFVSRNTVKTQLRSIYHKLDVSNRDEAVQRGRALGLL